MRTTIKQDIIWHIKNALTKKVTLIPFLAPCYLGIFILNFAWFYINDFARTILLKTDEERAAYIERTAVSQAEMHSKLIFAFYALTSTFIYWFVFGFSEHVSSWEILNLPTYYLVAIPTKAIEILWNTPSTAIEYLHHLARKPY